MSIFPNPRADRNAKLQFGDHERALAEIRTWPYYAPTPLIRLDGLARELGVGAILYKDEAHRFGLRSFKALGGAYAVLRVIQQRVAEHTGEIRSSARLLVHAEGHPPGDLSGQRRFGSQSEEAKQRVDGIRSNLWFSKHAHLSPVESDGRPSTYAQALNLIEKHKIDVAPIITHRYTSLDAVQGALEKDMRAPNYLKGVVVL